MKIIDDPLTILYPGDTLRVVMGQDEAAIFVDRSTISPQPSPFCFAWITDPHVGRPDYNPGHPSIDFAHVLEFAPAFMVVSGDCTHDGTLQQMQDYMACLPEGIPIHHLPGNHDEVGDYNAPPPNDYTNYEAIVGTFRWAFSCNGFRFIGFTTNLKRDTIYAGAGWVGAEDRAFVESNLSATERNILITHFPFSDQLGNNVHDWWNFDAGQSWLYNLGLNFDIVLLTGHRHLSGLHVFPLENHSLIEVNGGCLAYDENNGNGSFQIVTITNNQIQIDRYLGREPYNLLEDASL